MSQILIADDHAVTRAGYRQFLDAEPTVTLVGEAADGNEVLDMLGRQRWDLVLLDIHMPGRGGLDVLERIRAEYPTVRILVMSALPEDQYGRNVLKAGASGYLSKGADPAELLKAVRLVLSGRCYISSALAQVLVEDLDGAAKKPLHASLTIREFQIFCKIAQGLMISEIARETCLSDKTVITYRTRVMRKLRFESNADIMKYALRSEIVL